MINILTLKQLGFQDHVHFFMLIWFYKILSRSFIFIFVHGCRHTPCHGLCAEVRGQAECWSSSATLFETGCLLFTPACARLADLKASRDSPVSASHCWWECWHCRCVYCHVLICVGLIGSNSYPHIAHQTIWPSEPTLQPWACLFSDRKLNCTNLTNYVSIFI